MEAGPGRGLPRHLRAERRINPDYVPYTIALKDGQVLAGTVRAEGADAIRVTDTEAKVTVVPRAEIEDLRASATSIMPVGLVGAIGEAKMRDCWRS